ncbi:alpha/beta fold hydrolase [Nocardia mangyaensis]|uniref:alpha/beta fold hydrolase n=1 Tax=Nocardia mangyaensis TaxID=2213200 RepID=UPI0026747D48|nr:alpha/beta hydrolase [Nocardia mangyaensis]MDO3645593.1 alpha/beta hydrolase [Nocardia mangyaensis]
MTGVSSLHVHRFGPADGSVVLALHGLTGHGNRWENLAAEHLPRARVLAPDLRGHGRSPALPPWDFETIAEDLADLLRTETAGPVVVVGHSFGGAVGIHLARRNPELVRALVLLDPAIGIDAKLIEQIAIANLASPDYTDLAEARCDKQASAWGPDEVDPVILERELAEHLVPTEGGRVGWRIFQPAITSYWGQLARPFVLPPADLPTVLVRAAKVQPPYVTAEFRAALAEHLGERLTTHDWECDHMVAQARPAETAALIAAVL